MNLKASEMPLDANGNVYHLNLKPEELAHKIILVGDPERVAFFSQQFDSTEYRKQNREIVTHTGIYKGKRLSVLSTGMGTDNIDIVFNELDALVNIDLRRRCLKADRTTLEIVRLGTSGILQENIPLHTYIVSRYAIGMDSLLHYYQHGKLAPNNLLEQFKKDCDWSAQMPEPYAVSADETLLERVASDCLQGITLTAPGFYGPQCRVLRLPLSQGDFVSKLRNKTVNALPYTNLEMETAGIYGMAQLLGHRAVSISVGIANRVNGEFSKGYADAMMQLFENVVEKI